MPLKVQYRGLRMQAGTSAASFKEVMSRDASWGTYVKDLSAAELCCGQSSQSRWRMLEPQVSNELGGPEDATFTLSFPDVNFNFPSEGVDHLLGVVAGDILAHRDVLEVEASDLEFTALPANGFFPGPNVGVDRLYSDWFKRTLKSVPRPLLAFTVKPRRGHSVDDLEQLYLQASAGGVDIVEDDERLVDSTDCPFSDRVKRLAKRQEGGALYSVNVTGDTEDVKARIDYCAEHGIRMIKLDVLVCGFETLRRAACYVRDKYSGSMAITVYPDAYGAYRRLGRRFILRLARLCGADIIYAGSPAWARYAGASSGELNAEVGRLFHAHEVLADTVHAGIRTSLPTLTNDQHPSRAEYQTVLFRKMKAGYYQYAYFVGGGISAFPDQIKAACETWIRCLEWAATKPLDAYPQFKIPAKLDAKLRRMEWTPFDVRSLLDV